MDDSGEGAEVDEAVEPLPALTAETADPSSCRGEGERQHEDKRGEADGDEAALGDIWQYLSPRERFVKPEIRGEVEAAVEEREEPDHAAVLDEQRLLQQFPQRRDGERDEEEAERPVAGGVRDEL